MLKLVDMSLVQGGRSVAKYETEFLRLSRYARTLVAPDYDKCVRFEEGLRYNLRVLIAPQRELVFAVSVDKAKIVEEVKCTQRERRDRKNYQNKVKKDSSPSSSSQRPKKRARFDRLPRAEVPAVVTKIQLCGYCGKRHPDECWRKLGVCLCCGSMEHRVRDCPRQPNLVPTAAQTPAPNSVRSLKEVFQPFRGRGTGNGRGGNRSRRGHRAPDRGAGQVEARQPALVYAAKRCEESDDVDVIVGTFFIHYVPYYALIDIDPTHSYIASVVSVNLGLIIENIVREFSVISPLGQSI
ncbi:uncharacterized protein [Gossypium hirsutum]|uniref:Uncharacterized protein n=1 Tax=Gossypium hirsutum TaxID=3635 RepID=A0A1U8JJT9_GOSHI|nr:uncharacterized protein LOC107907734 [Gossypium hirsutum]